MPKNRITPNCEAVFVGPAPSTGYHFINFSGILNDDYNNLVNNYNLLFELYRINSFSYRITADRTNITCLGKRGTFATPLINPPVIDIQLDYGLMGVVNEARLGFNVNYARFEYPYSGAPYYSSKVCPLSGFIERNLVRDTGNFLAWPYSYRDKRNLFVLIAPNNEDAHYGYIPNLIEPDTYQEVDPFSLQRQVLCFGNCYLNSYSTQAAIGDFPRASVNLVAENMSMYMGASGQPIPAINEQNGMPIPNRHFVVPNSYSDGGPAALLPGDIVISIQNSSLSNDPINLSVSIPYSHINGYSISLNFNRQSLSSLGYKYPIDRQLNTPLFYDLSLTMTVGDSQTGSLSNLFQIDETYNVGIKLKNPITFNNITGNLTDGFTNVIKAVAVQYDMSNITFQGLSVADSVGRNKTATLDFRGEIDVDDLSKGLFISGLFNVLKTEDYLLYENVSGIISGDKTFLLYDDGTPIVIGYPPMY